MENNICRIAVFYDGTYFHKVSNYYLYQHDRRARLSIKGLHEFILDEVAKNEGLDKRRCQIVDAAYFRGRLTAQQAQDQDKLYSDRVFEDVLMRADVTMFQQHVSTRPDGCFEEKRIDVWLALEAYEMASLKKYDVCVLITGDGDFVPLVRKLNTLGSRVMLLGWDFAYERDGRMVETRVSTGLIDRVNYPVMMSTEIDSRENRLNPLIHGLFMPAQAAGPTAKGTAQQVNAGTEARKWGTIANLVAEKGYGFIKPAGGGDNLFFHANDFVDKDLANLELGAKVTYIAELGDKGKMVAHSVSPVGE